MIRSFSPIDGSLVGEVQPASKSSYDEIVARSVSAFESWRMVPAPKRGELIRIIADKVRARKRELGLLITTEMGKILSEGEGEVQEVIDIADFAVGLSRQLYGKTMHSERPLHRMYEQWHPLGPVGVITAFNFPMAVWAWNAFIAAVCGDTIIWKPSELTPICAKVLNEIAQEVATEFGFKDLFQVVYGDAEVGKWIAEDHRIPLVSATGSTKMGREVGQMVAKRFGKSILELGGNNAVIVLNDADLNLALNSIVFGVVGTAGQRCTSTRRVLIEKDVFNSFVESLKASFAKFSPGDPRKEGVLLGPLVSERAVVAYLSAVERAKSEGGELIIGGEVFKDLYVKPTIIRANESMSIVKEETFAPIVYVFEVESLSHAIRLNNSVPQGLSSSCFTTNLLSAEQFLSHQGSDCGIANINIGTSGAEIGGAFGGEKETGGGREAGSDSWKQYMRRQTNTINFSKELPLAQGVKFSVD
jgi:aldehyde dehydrogenase (NAD+)